MGKVQVNLIGIWNKGFSDPMWIMTNLEAKEGLRIYFARMKIEETLCLNLRLTQINLKFGYEFGQ
jgi:hypothetical protein